MGDGQDAGKGWRVTFAGMGINLALGVLYTWSVIKKAIPADWGWDDADKALPYSIACIVFALVMVPAGRLQDRIGPRWVATAGGVFTGLGLLLAAFSTTLGMYVVGFGVLAGIGIGLGYASATPPAVKWFPARRTGLIAGLVVAGFGLASVYISPLANYFTGNDLAGKPQGTLAAADKSSKAAAAQLGAARWLATQAEASPDGTIDPVDAAAGAAELATARDAAKAALEGAKAQKAAETKALSAALAKAEEAAKAGEAGLALVQAAPSPIDRATATSLVASKEAAKADATGKLRTIKEGNIHKTMLYFGIGFLIVVVILSQLLVPPPAGYVPPGSPTTAAAAAAVINIGPMTMLKTPLFWLLWLMFAFGAGAGLMIIGNITTIAKLGHIEAGFILVALLAVGNASGRILAGILSDKIGRTWTMFIIFVFQAALMMVLRTGLSEMTTFVVVSMLLGFNYGACLSVFPSATKDNFGLKNFGVNYGLVFTSWGVGGFVFPLAAGKIFETAKAATGTGSYDNAYLVAAAALALAAILTFVTRPLEKKHKETYAPKPA
ncbi:MAG: OFA family MFS transporter [Deltaproteobacteria bacterium]|nr:OFA family MFS transporter [Deltaproteobacteria bacterium]